ncbi:GntR family transcriptional regulator [Rhizobium hidalgonense]|uniref:GntR family transcriptional regulator n=1 Tax=Rhizobium hidalgonense TaxID=1538159 RepID=A0A2A6K6Q5_9HYPH|nr:GntR family transcriptional regulator [Rhizobium hidalgonense]EJC75377.1 transcriptional regulator [Rhizobium leguminosarum bv. trifolii WSM2012]MDR9776528.1 GntR family transcriptional regulator [Rhizobium hidalgonense]MDR9803237.1 GntR family transcriptional regulator [Rhizobium hidalgonense]MDR9814399.1 GntR family transcriptional regulator [Rhizobium hidalgonense]MDR9823104.1 GntR family transcriptional regulator [Rhizobium hidalgonense]
MKQVRRREIIRAGTTVEQMVRAIADMIVTGQMLPGEKLDEVSLAARFEVSRTPVREALRELGAMGLVDREPNRSAVVTTVTETYLHSMFEAMAELEAICARLSAERMTVDERRTLELEHKASMKLVHTGAEEDYAAHNTEFHSRLYRGAHNDHIYETVTQTRARLAPFRRAQFRLPGRLAKSYEEHGRIVIAIMRADGTAAAQAAYSHVEMVSDASAVFAATGEPSARST